MKSFKEAMDEEVKSTGLCQSMEKVIELCEKAVKRQGKKVSIDLLQGYTLEFFQKAFEVQILLPQEIFNSEENIQKYNDALWEDIEVDLLQRQIEGYNMPTSSSEREKYITNIRNLKAEIEENNQRKTARNSDKSKKNLAFRYWVGDRTQDYAVISDTRKDVPKDSLGWALFPYYAFIWEDGYVPNEIGIERVKYFKPVYILSMFLGESSNTRGHCMFQAFITQVNHNYRRFTGKSRSERRESNAQIAKRKDKAATEWVTEFVSSIEKLHATVSVKIAEMKKSKKPLSEEVIVLIREICEAYMDFSHHRIGEMLNEIEAINHDRNGQMEIDECGQWFQKNAGKMKADMEQCINHIWNCIELLSNNSNEAWRNQKVFSADIEYLKGIIKYASENDVAYSKALFVRCLDDLTDWVLYSQYLDSCKHGKLKGKTEIKSGRTDFVMYSGLELRQVSIETIDTAYVTKNNPFDVNRLNGDFWHYAQILKNRLTDMLPILSLKSDSSFSPNELFEKKLKLEFKYHDRIFSNLLECGDQNFGDKEVLCTFFEAVYEKRLAEKYFEKIS